MGRLSCRQIFCMFSTIPTPPSTGLYIRQIALVLIRRDCRLHICLVFFFYVQALSSNVHQRSSNTSFFFISLDNFLVSLCRLIFLQAGSTSEQHPRTSTNEQKNSLAQHQRSANIFNVCCDRLWIHHFLLQVQTTTSICCCCHPDKEKKGTTRDVGRQLPTNIQAWDYIVLCIHKIIKIDILGRTFYHLVFMFDKYLYNDIDGGGRDLV